MPLSEHEQKLLQQMEQALYAEDPHFVTRLQHSTGTAARRRLVLGIVGAVVGLGLVVLGVMNAQVVLGGFGFALMVAGAFVAMSPSKRRAAGPESAPTTTGRAPAAKQRRGVMQRLEERWERRRTDRP